MVNRTKHTKRWNKNLKWRKKQPKTPSRYKKYYDEITGLAPARRNLTALLSELLDQKSNEYWENTKKNVLIPMQNELIALGNVPNMKQTVPVLKYCVKFLGVIAKYQDMLGDGIHTAPGEKEKCLIQFNDDLFFMGRHQPEEKMKIGEDEYVPFWNISKPGEPVTEFNVCWGPEIHTASRNAHYWITLSKHKCVTVTQTQHYLKGALNRKILIWATEALVKYSPIYQFCKIGRERMLDNLEFLLQ